MKFFKSYLFAAAAITFIYACKKDSIAPGSASFNYFPIETGRYVIYNVDSVLHGENDNNTDDSVYTLHFQLKEVVGDTFIDGEGRPAQILKRYRRDVDTLPWNQISSWTQVLTSSSAYRTEENVPYHKLSFPITDHISWNGNDANTQQEEIYLYEDFHVNLTMNGLHFDSTLSVLQRDDDNFVQRIYSKEIYANNVGMIYKVRDHLSKINGLVVKGTEYRMKVAGYGME